MTMKRQDLNDNWMLREAPLDCTAEQASWISRQETGWLENLTLPLDVHQPLIAAGRIKDPVLADYSDDAAWVERRSWWFRRQIRPESGWADCDTVELVMASLDVHADIFFNGRWLGHHPSAHVPFHADIRPWLHDDDNELLIRLTSGLESVRDTDLAEIDFAVSTEAGNGCPERGDKRRAFVRKPTYVYGWDWCPRIGTCGIVKPVWLEYHRSLAIRAVSVETREIRHGDGHCEADLHIEAEIDNLNLLATADADAAVRVSCGDDEAIAVQTDLLLRSGTNHIAFDLTVQDAQIWWPNGMGAQPLYTVAVNLSHGGRTIGFPPFKAGLRLIRLDTSRQEDQRRRFRLVVNGVPMFCKGADWIPADSIYARVTPEKYAALIRQAQLAHINMLRIWGGGLYEQEAFYEACDRAGILIWQDMMFGCAAYPDHREDFRALVWREFDHQTKRLRNHACLALFCGNNENHWIYGRRLKERLTKDRQYGLYTANAMLPDILSKNAPWIPYWNSSPYGGSEPNDPAVGDIHYWHEAMMNPDMLRRIDPCQYDRIDAAFVSEYGYPGPPVRRSIECYFDGHPIDRSGKIWKRHTNTFEKLTVEAGIRRHFTDRPLDLDGYLLYAGLVQGLMLGYSLEALRFKTRCAGALFWMYNDCWGEIGWTIVDSFVRRKIAYHAVRRALMPVRLILRRLDGQVAVVGCNDGQVPVKMSLETGWISFDGQERRTVRKLVTLPAQSREELARIEPDQPETGGLYVAYPGEISGEAAVIPALLIDTPYRELALCPPRAMILDERDDGADRLVTVQAETFVAAAWLDADPDLELDDNFFTLLPGESRNVRISGGAGQPAALRIAQVDPLR